MTLRSLDRESALPLYHQVHRVLLHKIASGEYPVGSRLPTEDELAAALGVSKITVRHGVELLVSEKIVQRIPGRGTFVLRDDIEYAREASELLGFSEEMIQAGRRPASQELEKRAIEPTPIIRQRLRIPSDARVLLLKRLRSIDNVPLAVQTAYLPLHRFPEIERFDFSQRSLYDVLEREYHTELARARQSFRIAYPDACTARYLGIQITEPGFGARRLTFDTRGEPVEYVETFFRGDRFAVDLELVRSRKDPGAGSHGGRRHPQEA